MFDFIDLRFPINGGNVSEKYISEYGTIKMVHESFKLRYNQREDMLMLSGSLPYFLQGHNFCFNLDQARQTIDMLSEMLKIDLWQARVSRFEYGVVIFPQSGINEIIDTHRQLKNFNQDIYLGRGKSYTHRQNRSRALKIYSLWANLRSNPMKVKTPIKQQLRDSCYSPKNNPIKCEFRESARNMISDRDLLVSELLSKDFEDRCKNHLLRLYGLVEKHDTLQIEGQTDTISMLLALLSDKDPHYLEHIIELIDRSELKEAAKAARKTDIRRRVKLLQRKAGRNSLEPLIVEAFGEMVA